MSIRPAGSKLSPRFRGPFVIIHKINPVSYILMNTTSRVTFSSHVSQLKLYHEPLNTEETAVEIERILPAELFPISVEWVDDSSDDDEITQLVNPIRLRNNFGDWQLIAPLFESSDFDDTFWMLQSIEPVASPASVVLPGESPTLSLTDQRLHSL